MGEFGGLCDFRTSYNQHRITGGRLKCAGSSPPPVPVPITTPPPSPNPSPSPSPRPGPVNFPPLSGSAAGWILHVGAWAGCSNLLSPATLLLFPSKTIYTKGMGGLKLKPRTQLLGEPRRSSCGWCRPDARHLHDRSSANLPCQEAACTVGFWGHQLLNLGIWTVVNISPKPAYWIKSKPSLSQAASLSLSFFLSFFLSFSLSLSLSIHTHIYIYIYLYLPYTNPLATVC